MGGPSPDKFSPFRAGLTAKCPECGKGKLYSGYLKITEECAVCHVKIGEKDTGDGPAVFVMFVMGFLVLGLALVVEVKYAPPLWLHMSIWTPLVLGGSLALLPLFKSVMFAAQYHTKAGERVERVDGDPS